MEGNRIPKRLMYEFGNNKQAQSCTNLFGETEFKEV
jgi:hypothetical protein